MPVISTGLLSIRRKSAEVKREEANWGRSFHFPCRASIEEQEERSLYPLSAPATKPCEIKMIPYYAWDNHAPGEMLVWLRRES